MIRDAKKMPEEKRGREKSRVRQQAFVRWLVRSSVFDDNAYLMFPP